MTKIVVVALVIWQSIAVMQDKQLMRNMKVEVDSNAHAFPVGKGKPDKQDDEKTLAPSKNENENVPEPAAHEKTPEPTHEPTPKPTPEPTQPICYHDPPEQETCSDGMASCALRGREFQCLVARQTMFNDKCYKTCCSCAEQRGFLYGFTSSIPTALWLTPLCQYDYPLKSHVRTKKGENTDHSWVGPKLGNVYFRDMIVHVNPSSRSRYRETMFAVGSSGDVWMLSQGLCDMLVDDYSPIFDFPQFGYHQLPVSWSVMSKTIGATQIAIWLDSIYALGLHQSIWKQELVGMNLESDWERASAGEIVRFTIDKKNGVMYGIKKDKKIYAQSIVSMSPASSWNKSVHGPPVEDIQVYRGVLYAAGADGIYRQSITCMTPDSTLEHVSMGHMRIIFYGNHIYGIAVGQGGDVFKKHVRHLIPSEKNKDWTFFKRGPISTIVASGQCKVGGTGEAMKVEKAHVMRLSGSWKLMKHVIGQHCFSSGVETEQGTEKAEEIGNSISAGLSMTASAGIDVKIFSVGTEITVSAEYSHEWSKTMTTSFSKAMSEDVGDCINSKDFNADYLWQWVLEGQLQDGSVHSVYTRKFYALTNRSSVEPKCLPGCAADGDNVEKKNPAYTGNYQICHNDGDLCGGCGWLDRAKCPNLPQTR